MKHKSGLITKIFIFFFFYSTACISFAQDSKSVSIIKVACIGNSITYGSGIADREMNSYPASLGRLLGTNYEVGNFGVSGRTLLRNGDYPYWNETAYRDAIDFLPDIVIIKLGTNDSKPQNWRYKNEFERDYNDFIRSFSILPTHPKIFICKPVPAYEVKWGIRDSVIVNEQIPIISKIGEENNVGVIDLYNPFLDKGKFFPDGIHPDAEGASLMAKEIYNAITNYKIK